MGVRFIYIYIKKHTVAFFFDPSSCAAAGG